MSESLVFSNGTYSRGTHPSLERLAEILRNRYSAKYALITTSGMHAISTVFNGLIDNHKILGVIYGNELYCDTPRLIEYVCKRKNIPTGTFALDVFDASNTSNSLMYFIESCSNPNGHVFDFNTIPKLRENPCIIVCDNTWTTDVLINPLVHGVDIVVGSLSKHYSNGTSIGGFIVTNSDQYYNDMLEWTVVNGFHMSKHNAEIICQNITSVNERVIKARQLTVAVIGQLLALTHSKLIKIEHPLVHNSTQYFNAPTVFTIYSPISKNKGVKILQSSPFEYKTSFGGAKTTIDPYPKLVNGSFMWRVSIGHDDVADDIVLKLKSVLDRM